MKITPYHIIGGSSVLALIVLLLYFYQTSPKVTDIPPEPVKVEVVDETPEPSAEEEAPVDEAEASLETEMGITLARVRPDGTAVIAGNAPEGSTVNIYNDGLLIGSTTVSGSDEWVIIPEQPLPAGAHLLTLEIIGPDGTRTIGAMALAVEIPANGSDTPLVALVPYTDEVTTQAKVLQAPEALEPAEDTVVSTSTESAENIVSSDADQASNDPVVMPRLTIRSVQALNPGLMSVSGRAEGGSSIHISVNGMAAEPARADDKSLYAVTLPIDGSASSFKLLGVLKNDAGDDIASASITLSRGQVEQSMGSNTLIVVQKGDALWRIAYKTYGQGIRYIDIYRQNQTAINNPDLIYPDQVFVVPNS